MCTGDGDSAKGAGTAGDADTWESWNEQIRSAACAYVKKLSRKMRNTLRERQGLWFRNDCVVVPAEGLLRQDIVRAHHSTLTGGHFDVAKTYQSICRPGGYWWPGMKHDVLTVVQNCHECQTNKPSNK
jgi:hypothetical protein